MVILGLPPVDALDVVGPAEVFALANQFRADKTAPYALELVCAASDLLLSSDTGIGLLGHRTLEQQRQDKRPIDTLIVAAGFWAIDKFDKDAIAWIGEQAKRVRRVCSICVGAFALADAGVLDARRATTHWCMTQKLSERYPRVQVEPDPIWVKDGNVYTSAGISAGIDLALALVGEDLGDDVALDIAKNMVLFLRRPGGQAQFSVALRSQLELGSDLSELCLWIADHLHSDLTVETLAERMSTSVRTLIRTFQREMKTTPAKYVEDVRLEAVCRALEIGSRSMDELARRHGYNSVDVLRKAFVRRLGVSPREYAQRFSAIGEVG